jgi:hypothetical protein
MGQVRMVNQDRAVVPRDTAGWEDMDTVREEAIGQGTLDQVDMEQQEESGWAGQVAKENKSVPAQEALGNPLVLQYE